jgi:5-methylcytosine-specific restriction endonuclease McrA
MTAALHRLVRWRADNRCEYCRLHQDEAAFARFHIEHITAKQHGGSNRADNLALACHRCNSFKGPNLSGIDQLTKKIVPLFHPRRQQWARHFLWRGARVVGLSRTGRATIAVLNMNEPRRLAVRKALARVGLHPPPTR